MPTLRDVAGLAGVSVATVSNVVNNTLRALRIIRAAQPASRPGLSCRLGIHRSTVSEVVAPLPDAVNVPESPTRARGARLKPRYFSPSRKVSPAVTPKG